MNIIAGGYEEADTSIKSTSLLPLKLRLEYITRVYRQEFESKNSNATHFGECHLATRKHSSTFDKIDINKVKLKMATLLHSTNFAHIKLPLMKAS